MGTQPSSWLCDVSRPGRLRPSRARVLAALPPVTVRVRGPGPCPGSEQPGPSPAPAEGERRDHRHYGGDPGGGTQPGTVLRPKPGGEAQACRRGDGAQSQRRRATDADRRFPPGPDGGVRWRLFRVAAPPGLRDLPAGSQQCGRTQWDVGTPHVGRRNQPTESNPHLAIASSKTGEGHHLLS